MQELIAYQTFASAAEADEVAAQLINAGIPAEVAKKAQPLDVVIAGDDYSDGYIIRIPPACFEQANDLLYVKELDVSTIDAAHPLCALTNDELKEVIARPDEWGMDNYSIAMALLKSRGMIMSDKLLAEIKQDRIEELSVRRPASGWLLLTGYLSALAPLARNYMYGHDRISPSVGYIIWFFPGFAGLFISGLLLQAKITLPNGTRIPAYNDAVLRQAMIILALNILSWVVNIVWLVYLIT